MGFRGDIASFSLGDVFQNLAANQKTGTLKIQRGQVQLFVLFREGKAVSYADNQGFSIGEWLVDKGIVQREQLEEATKRFKKAKKKSLGEILRDMQVISEEDYVSYLKSLVQETIYEVLSLQDGAFEFLTTTDDEGVHREATAAGLAFPAQSLLMEAARRSDDWHNIRRHIPSEDEIYVVAPSTREKLLTESEDEVVKEAIQLLDGKHTLRKVIGTLPYTRFDACRAIAHLIAEKKAKLLDGSALPQVEGVKEDPKQAIACLKTILEREPNNRQILQQLAEQHAKSGQRDESATCWKLLAVSFLTDGQLNNGERCLRKSIELNSKDIVTWNKLLDTVRRSGDGARFERLAAAFASHFKTLGLTEVVRDHLVTMVKQFPRNLEFRLGLADARFALGDRKTCIAELLPIGLEFHRKQQWAEAERVLDQVVKYDGSNMKARKTLDEIRTGAAQRRREFRRRAFRTALHGAFLAAVAVYVGYDYWVRNELFRVTRSVYAESRLEYGGEGELVEQIKAIEKRYPFTYTSLREAAPLRAALEERKRSRKRQAEAQRRPAEVEAARAAK